MKLVELKSHTELPGLYHPEFVFENDSLKEVRFNDGNYIIKVKDWNALAVFERKLYEEQERYAVRGTVAGVQLEEMHEDLVKANQRQLELAKATGYQSEFSVDIVKILVDERGEVKGTLLEHPKGGCALPARAA